MQQILDSFRLKLPFLIAGGTSLVLSVYLYFIEEDKTAAIFVGLWVPSIFAVGALLLSADPEHVLAEHDARKAQS